MTRDIVGGGVGLGCTQAGAAELSPLLAALGLLVTFRRRKAAGC